MQPDQALVLQEPAGLPEEADWLEPRPGPDCICDGVGPWCPVCLVAIAMYLRYEHPDTLSVGMLRRRIPGLRGREAAILLEASKRMGDVRPPPEPRLLSSPRLLLYSEAKALEVIRANPGVTRQEVSEALGRTRDYVRTTINMLLTGGDIRAEHSGTRNDPQHLYPTHDRPVIVHQRGRPQARFRAAT